jgi:endogenous inhibitor of DNA gyrase (YacG/DUF329 family)
MFFFIAGVQPKTVALEGQNVRCPVCGLHQAAMKRVDHYLSIFFLPLFRVKKGSPFLECQSCGSLTRESGEVLYQSHGERPGRNCPHCGKPLEPEFRFCPFCGKIP